MVGMQILLAIPAELEVLVAFPRRLFQSRCDLRFVIQDADQQYQLVNSHLPILLQVAAMRLR
jgi:hypothetical protein